MKELRCCTVVYFNERVESAVNFMGVGSAAQFSGIEGVSRPMVKF